jgi:uncharacterized protein YbaR (Trm112 family)
MLDPELLSLLVCPNCRGDVEYREEDEVIACIGECGYRYRVVKDIPHMLVEEALKD